MSRIQQLAEHAKMRDDLVRIGDTADTAWREACSLAVAHNDLLARVMALEETIASLRSIVSALESPRGPGRPRKDHGGSTGIRAGTTS